MDKNLVVNHAGLEGGTLEVRRRGQPTIFANFNTADLLALASVLTSGRASDNAADIRGAMVRAGLLVQPHEVPADRDDLTFRCDLDEQTLSHVPLELLASTPILPVDALELNPGLCVQASGGMPAEVASRVKFKKRVVRGPARFASERPIVWVEEPRWQTLTPIWFGGSWGQDLRRLVIDRAPLEAFSAESIRVFQLAGILLPRTVSTSRAAVDELAAESFHGCQMAVVRNLFSPFFLGALRRHYRAMRAEGYFTVDQKQVVGKRDGMYCDAVTLFLQHQLTRMVSAYTGAEVKPSYTWVMTYNAGAELLRHRDRPQCRWNMSFCIDADPDLGRTESWPLYIEASGLENRSDLGIGDAVIYSGTEQDHWRDELPDGRQVTLCLFHYVNQDFRASLD